MFTTSRDWTLPVYIQFFLLIILFLYIYYKFIYSKNNNKTSLVFQTLFYTYIIGVLFVTILPLDFQYFEFTTVPWSTNNFIHPFEDLLLNRTGALKGIILNVIMLIPFGILLPTIKKLTFIKCILYGLSFIFIIECSQMILSLMSIGFRSFDITDIITNIIGVCIGYIIYKISYLIYYKFK
ncbi:MAG: VanZ family protein [Coprobacillus sp.]